MTERAGGGDAVFVHCGATQKVTGVSCAAAKNPRDLGNLAGEWVYDLDKKRAFSGNGSDDINKRVADLLEKPFIAFTPKEDVLLGRFKACIAGGLFADDGLVTEALWGRYRWNELRGL